MRAVVRRDLRKPYGATVAPGGTATVEIFPTGTIAWDVTQVSVRMRNAPAGAACELLVNGVFETFLVASGDAAVTPPPILLQPGDRITVAWTSCTPGDTGTVLIHYDEVDDR